MPRRKMQPYHCPRCGYDIEKKSSMVSHFSKLKKPCPAIENVIELTPEIIEHILANRIYKIPKQDKKTTIINNYNQVNNVNNIIAGMDAIEKLEHYMTFKNQSLIDFDTTVENKFKKTVKQLDHDQFRANYFLDEDSILKMVGKASEPSPHEKDPICTHNVIFDKKLKELKIFDGSWEAMSLDAGTKLYIERIQSNFLNSYEQYLLRNLKNKKQGQDRALFREMLERYFMFISCFNLEPFCKDANDDEILTPGEVVDSDCSSECSDSDSDRVSTCSEGSSYTFSRVHTPSYAIREEYYPVFRKAVNNVTKPFLNRMIRSVQDVIKRNSAKNVLQLNREITKIFHMDEDFRNIILGLKLEA